MSTTFSKVFCLAGALLMLVPGELLLAQEQGKIIVISEQVGETIDREERDHYGLFQASKNFLSAVILQLPDSSYLAEITEEKDGEEQVRTLPMDRFALHRLREYIASFSNFTPEARKEFLVRQTDDARQRDKQSAVDVAREQARKLAREKWTRERWREETLYDRGWTYRHSGPILGFTVGAAAGMLIGKGFQGKKTTREYVPPWTGDWGGTEGDYWENYHTYERKEAPIWGAAIGGVAGGITGYYLGKKKDKEYYILVPKDIRVKKTKGSAIGSCILGGVLFGPVLGVVAEATLPTPSFEIEREGESNFDWDFFLSGYLAGSILGSLALRGCANRAKHRQLWEESLSREESESSLDIELMPLDPTAFTLRPRRLPSGDIIHEYHVDILRASF